MGGREMEDREDIQGLQPVRPLSQSPAEGATARRVQNWLEADCARLSGAIRQPLNERTEEEARILKDLAADSRIDAVLLLNRYGQVRWAKDSACDGWGFDEVEKADRGTGELLLSLCRSKIATARRASKSKDFEVGLPLMVKDHLVGVLLVTVPDAP